MENSDNFIDFLDSKEFGIWKYGNIEIRPRYMSLKYLQNSFKEIYNQFYLVIRMAKVIESIQ